jgi:phosphoglycolate phosphatase
MLHLIWDLDGTLIDSSKEIIACLELAVRNSGIELSRQISPFVVGPTIDIILKKAFPAGYLAEDVLKQAIMNFRAIYDNSKFEMTKPFLGIETIIKANHLFVHHVITNKPDKPTSRILQKLGWTTYITSVNTPYTEGNVSFEKSLRSKDELFSDVIKKYDGHSLFIGIGDMAIDCIAARANNIKSLGVLWGTGTREELSKCCDSLFDDTKQLCDYLYKIA